MAHKSRLRKGRVIGLVEARIVGRGAVDCRDGDVEQTQEHRQLPAVMRKVAHRIADHDVARSLRDHVAFHN